MRVPYIPSSSQVGRQTITKHIQRGGELPGVQYGTGFFGSLWNGVKKLAVPVLKSVAKEAFPMPTQALSAGLGPKEGGLKAKLKAAGQSAVKKENLLRLGKAATRPVF